MQCQLKCLIRRRFASASPAIRNGNRKLPNNVKSGASDEGLRGVNCHSQAHQGVVLENDLHAQIINYAPFRVAEATTNADDVSPPMEVLTIAAVIGRLIEIWISVSILV